MKGNSSEPPMFSKKKEATVAQDDDSDSDGLDFEDKPAGPSDLKATLI
jgi:hypothetical protein